jgi:DnaJ-class molecular chaperone
VAEYRWIGDFGGYGWAICPTCSGRGHWIGVATTTAADCRTCHGNGKVSWGRWPNYNPTSEHDEGTRMVPPPLAITK